MSTKYLWREDECTIHDPLHEHIEAAWLRLFKTKLVTANAIAELDLGDAVEFKFANGYTASFSYPGNSAIYKTPTKKGKSQ